MVEFKGKQEMSCEEMGEIIMGNWDLREFGV